VQRPSVADCDGGMFAVLRSAPVCYSRQWMVTQQKVSLSNEKQLLSLSTWSSCFLGANSAAVLEHIKQVLLHMQQSTKCSESMLLHVARRTWIVLGHCTAVEPVELPQLDIGSLWSVADS